MPTINLTPLQSRIMRDIVSWVRRGQLATGAHVAESRLARVLGASRSPIKVVLNILASQGIFMHDKNRGFFMACNASELSDMAEQLLSSNSDNLYQHITRLRFTGNLPDYFTEVELMRKLQVSRTLLRSVLMRTQQEGWMEFRAGQGWKLLPIIDSMMAWRESYTLRTMIEPMAILSENFIISREQLEHCYRQQRCIAERGYRTMTPLELFEANSHFHETLAGCSGNRFLLQTICRINQLRRLVEYQLVRHGVSSNKGQSGEHLHIIELLLQGNREAAANEMRLHLECASNRPFSFDNLCTFQNSA